MLPFTVLGTLERKIQGEERAKWNPVECGGGGVFSHVLIVEIKIILPRFYTSPYAPK